MHCAHQIQFKYMDSVGTYILGLDYLITSILLIPSLVYNILRAAPMFYLIHIF